MEFEVKDYQTMQKSIADFCRFLTDFGLTPENIFDCRLVANELLGNVLRHAKAQASLHGKIENGFVVLTVRSTAKFIPPKKSVCSDVYAEHGRGLYLVDSVCAERITTEDGDVLVRIKIR
ncbi:MAG: ATP-binding protein [Clostridia bacterium]|nr:ATP-binding protein [Clostridia bacterium]